MNQSLKLWVMCAVLTAGVLVGSTEAVVAANGSGETLTILHRQSQVMQTPWKVVRVAVTDPLIADVKVLTPSQILVQGLSIGTTDILLWSEDETQVMQKTVKGAMDIETLGQTFRSLFPTSRIKLEVSVQAVLLNSHLSLLMMEQECHLNGNSTHHANTR